MSMSRRDLLKLSGLAAAGAATTAFAGQGAPAHTCALREAAIPKAKGPRVVVVGAGPSGLTIAKYVKKNSPKADVVLIDKRAVFMSGFISNLVASGVLPLEFITHDFLEGARNNNYTFLQATVYDIDRAKKTVVTTEGTVKYDVLVLAPGIDYDYSKWSKGDVELETALKTQYPAAFIPGSETLSLKSKIENFEGGNFVVTVPGGNYRCLPGPYERACLIAANMQRNKVKGKVIILDENPNITIKADGFHSAMKDLYSGIIEYIPSSAVEKIDLGKKKITTSLGDEVDFTDAALYPRVRGGKILEIAGVAKDSVFNKAEADIDPFTYQVVGDPYVFCAGDVRPMGFSKSANTANTEGQYVASLIAKVLDGKGVSRADWVSPHTTCYSAVAVPGDKSTMRAIAVNAGYAYDDAKKSFGFHDASTMEDWKSAKGLDAGRSLLAWGNGLYNDFFHK